MPAREIGLFPLAVVLVPGELMPLQIVEVTERFDDGRMNLVVRGGEVVRVLGLTRGRTYITGRVEPVTDPEEDAAREAASALALYQQVAEATGNEPDPALTADLD